MNISQLENYNLGDAVKFHSRLNPELWDRRENLHSEVRSHLLKIADDFATFLGVDNVNIEDITFSGSNAAYTYTKHSDIDLHLVVRRPEDPVYRELFDSKKHIYNREHDIEIHGIPVELYVQDHDQPAVSQGIYSVLKGDWLEVPRKQRAVIDDVSVRGRYQNLQQQIKEAISTDDSHQIDRLFKKLKRLRQTGLTQNGEFGPENLAYKMLRSQGYIDRLADARSKARSQELSLDELAKQSVRYGYTSQLDEVGISPDGTNPTTSQFTNEDSELSGEEILNDFVDFCAGKLNLEQLPTIKLRKDPQWSVVNKTFGRYDRDRDVLEVSWGNRHIMDVLRTVGHELTHRHQHERDGDSMGADAGETGSEWENEANARAGILMRDYAGLHPDYFSAGQAHDLNESYTVNDFALNEYKDMDAYRRWYRSGGKESTRGMTRLWPDRYGNLFVDLNLIESTNNFHKHLSQSKALSTTLQDMDMRSSIVIKIGNKLSVISTTAVPSETGGRIELAGFVTPKTIEKINLDHNNKIDHIVFDNGDRFPEAAEYTTLGGNNITTTAFFSDQSSASQAFTKLWFDLSRLEGDGWKIERYMSESKLTEASGYIPTAAEANDPRFSMALTKDVRPGATGRAANALKLNTDSQGHPQKLRADGLVERMMEEYSQFKKKTIVKESKKLTSADILQFNNIPALMKVRMLEELHLTGSASLLESIDPERVEYLKSLKEKYSASLKIGSYYIPVFILGFDNKLVVHDTEGNSPPVSMATLLKLTAINDDKLTFKNESTGKTLTYPDDIVGRNAYSVVITPDSVDQYNNLSTWLQLKDSITMPPAGGENDL